MHVGVTYTCLFRIGRQGSGGLDGPDVECMTEFVCRGGGGGGGQGLSQDFKTWCPKLVIYLDVQSLMGDHKILRFQP